MSSAICQTELACVYSALMLTDDGLEITPDAIRNILKAAGYECESFWPKFFCEGIKGLDIQSLIANVSSAPASASAAPVAAAAPKEVKGAKEVKKEPEPQSEDDDIGISSMFD